MYREKEGEKGYHGVPRRSCDCTAMNQAKMPRQIAEPASTMMIQMLSWSSGQRYRRRRWTRAAIVGGRCGVVYSR